MDNDTNTKKEFSKIICILAEEFGGSVSKNLFKAKFEVLKEYSLTDISRASFWLLKNREKTFPAVPTTKEIIQAIKKTNGSDGPATKSRNQLEIVMKYFNHYGRDCKHAFKDTITLSLMTTRWSMWQLGGMSQDDLKWFKKEFISEYELLSKENQNTNMIENKQENLKIPVNNLKQLLNKKENLNIVPIKKAPVNKYKGL